MDGWYEIRGKYNSRENISIRGWRNNIEREREPEEEKNSQRTEDRKNSYIAHKQARKAR